MPKEDEADSKDKTDLAEVHDLSALSADDALAELLKIAASVISAEKSNNLNDDKTVFVKMSRKKLKRKAARKKKQ